MHRSVILFEDHTAEGFRPLSWSLPVYELRCGVLNLRERVARLAAERPLGLLPRGLLLPLQLATLPAGAIAGPDACRTQVAGGGALFLNARLGPDEGLLAALLAEASDQPWGWWDGEALLACRLPGAQAAALIDEWAQWDATAAREGAWVRSDRRAGCFAAGPARAGEDAGVRVGPAAGSGLPRSFGHLWELVPALGAALTADARALAGGAGLRRRLFGCAPDPTAWPRGFPWEQETHFAPLVTPPGVFVQGPAPLAAPGVRLDPGVVLDTESGPIIFDREVRVQPHVYLQGPLYVGPAAVVKAGARVYGETSLGAGCRVAGEIGESLFLDFVNKQHDGFIGHAALGNWVNLGAGTTCSDLKNNYGSIRVDYGLGERDTGQRFLGLMMGEHAKSAIGTLFNTGTVVGFGSNVFGAGFPPKFLPNLTWGDPAGPRYDARRAAEVARVVMGRRGCRCLPEHAALFAALGGGS